MASFSSVLRRLGRRIRELRKARGLSQEKLAHEAGISRTYMGTIELGTKQPTLWTLFRIARALGVPIAEALLPSRSEVPEGGDVIARIHASLVEKKRSLSELRKIEAVIEAVLRKGPLRTP